MVRVNYCATTMKSCVDTAIALRCRGVGGRHRSKASKEDHCCAIGVGCQKEGGVGSFFLEKDEEKRIEGIVPM
jgi:hypothetical protein